MEKHVKNCPLCGAEINAEAIKCRYCHAVLNKNTAEKIAAIIRQNAERAMPFIDSVINKLKIVARPLVKVLEKAVFALERKIAKKMSIPEDQLRTEIPADTKSRTLYCIFAVLFGFLGLHNFYIGQNKKGFIKFIVSLLLFWTVIAPIAMLIWADVEAFITERDKNGNLMVGIPLIRKILVGIAGAIHGIIGLVLLITIIVGIVTLPARREDIRNRIRCTANMKLMGTELMRYKLNHNNTYPHRPGQTGLRQGTSKIYTCSGKNAEQRRKMYAAYSDASASYLYIGYNVEHKRFIRFPVLIERPGNHSDGTNVLFSDGTVIFLKGDFENVLDVVEKLTEKINDESVKAQLKKNAEELIQLDNAGKKIGSTAGFRFPGEISTENNNVRSAKNTLIELQRNPPDTDYCYAVIKERGTINNALNNKMNSEEKLQEALKKIDQTANEYKNKRLFMSQTEKQKDNTDILSCIILCVNDCQKIAVFDYGFNRTSNGDPNVLVVNYAIMFDPELYRYKNFDILFSTLGFTRTKKSDSTLTITVVKDNETVSYYGKSSDFNMEHIKGFTLNANQYSMIRIGRFSYAGNYPLIAAIPCDRKLFFQSGNRVHIVLNLKAQPWLKMAEIRILNDEDKKNVLDGICKADHMGNTYYAQKINHSKYRDHRKIELKIRKPVEYSQGQPVVNGKLTTIETELNISDIPGLSKLRQEIPYHENSEGDFSIFSYDHNMLRGILSLPIPSEKSEAVKELDERIFFLNEFIRRYKNNERSNSKEFQEMKRMQEKYLELLKFHKL